MRLYIVTSEYPGGTEFLMTVFTSKHKALKSYKAMNEEVSLDVYKKEIISDNENQKEIFYFDGTYGLTISFREIESNQEFHLF